MPNLNLPFKVLPLDQPETVDLGDERSGILPVPKLGCLKVKEEIAIAAYFANVAPDVPMSVAMVEVVTILLKSRFLPEWTSEHTKALPDFGLVEKLYEFIGNERQRWQPSEAAIKNAIAFLEQNDYSVTSPAQPDNTEPVLDDEAATAQTTAKKQRIGQKSGSELDSTTPVSNATAPKSLAIAS